MDLRAKYQELIHNQENVSFAVASAFSNAFLDAYIDTVAPGYRTETEENFGATAQEIFMHQLMVENFDLKDQVQQERAHYTRMMIEPVVLEHNVREGITTDGTHIYDRVVAHAEMISEEEHEAMRYILLASKLFVDKNMPMSKQEQAHVGMVDNSAVHSVAFLQHLSAATHLDLDEAVWALEILDNAAEKQMLRRKETEFKYIESGKEMIFKTKDPTAYLELLDPAENNYPVSIAKYNQN